MVTLTKLFNPKTIKQKIYNLSSKICLKNQQDLYNLLRKAVTRKIIDSKTGSMLEGVMEISELRVEDLMIPRAQISFLHENLSIEECIKTVIGTAHSRFPVLKEPNTDNIAGILHAKDLLKYLQNPTNDFELTTLLRPAVIVPESKRVDQMLNSFRSDRFHMALVIDEFGAIAGLITIEDILEHIVGEIDDEFDKQVVKIRKLSKHSYAVLALTSIEKFNEFFKCDFNDEELDTIGGLICNHLGHLPKIGETIELEGINFKVTSADSRYPIKFRVTISEERLKQINQEKSDD